MVQSALDAIFADAESIFFLFASKRGVNQGSEASKTLFPESDLVPNESQSAPPRNGVSDFAALPLLSPNFSSLLRFFAGVQSPVGRIARRRERPSERLPRSILGRTSPCYGGCA